MRAVEEFRDHNREAIFILGLTTLLGGLFFGGFMILASIHADTSMIADEPHTLSETLIGYGILFTPVAAIVIGSALMIWARRLSPKPIHNS